MATNITYAQNNEDIMLWRALSDIKNGFYIDVGANHPVHDSVTKLFYKNNWHGINIEPLLKYYKLLCKDRPRDINLNICVDKKIGTQTFYQVMNCEGLSTLDVSIAKYHQEKSGYRLKEIQMNVTPLNEIIHHYKVKEIHFLKIDVEGKEMNVLESLDLSVHRPWIIVLESVVSTDQNLEQLLLANQYECVWFDGLNQFYLAAEHKHLKKHFLLPPNIFDDFIKAHYHDLLVKYQLFLNLTMPFRLPFKVFKYFKRTCFNKSFSHSKV